jgi:Asp-tRNA(Asn)/Glu-tRNA(Gln) amidotransferase A subunit family amidase
MSTQDDLERELDTLLARAGANVPPELKPGLLAGYRDMKRMAAMHQPRAAAVEPSNIFSLKVGMQIVGRAFDEATVLRIGAAYETAAGWIHQRPELELRIAV